MGLRQSGFLPSMLEHQHILRYNINSMPKGKALIININNYNDEKLYPRRDGSENDVNDLKNLFELLGIETDVLPDLSHADLLNQTKVFGKDPVFSKLSMLVYVVMAHGGKDSEIYPKDGKPINIEDLVDLFDDTNCPDLKEKPKWFIFQTCRGDKLDSENFQSDQQVSQTDSKISKNGLEKRKSLATKRDVIISYSTIPGHVSLRTPSGTWFIQTLCKVFKEKAKRAHLEELLKLTSLELSKKNSETYGSQTCCIELHGFDHYLYFYPKKGIRERFLSFFSLTKSQKPIN